MKKFVFLVIFLGVVFCVFGQSASDFVYRQENGGITITGYRNIKEAVADGDGFYYNGKEVVIPDSINGLPVLAIGEGAFDPMFGVIGGKIYRGNIKSVVIPDSVKSIGVKAFAHNILTSVTISNSVTIIGEDAFMSNHLTHVTIPDSVTTIGVGAFYGNYLTSVTIPDSVITIGDEAFKKNRLTSVVIPNSVKELGTEVFDRNVEQVSDPALFAPTASDYNKILSGDLSAFAGYWVNGNNDRAYLRPNGVLYRRYSGEDNKADRPYKKTDGSYEWTVFGSGGGYGIRLIPAGIPFPNNVKTDTTRVRLTAGHEIGSDPDRVYYKESKFPATHSAVDNVRLRTDQNVGSSTITILEKGTTVLIQEWGNLQTIDGLTARWAYVYTPNGAHGWCYSGYLEAIKG